MRAQNQAAQNKNAEVAQQWSPRKQKVFLVVFPLTYGFLIFADRFIDVTP